jgi:hypothetical protein
MASPDTLLITVLDALHAEILAGIDEVALQAQQPSPQGTDISNARQRLAMVRSQHIRFTETYVYPALLAVITPEQAENIVKLRAYAQQVASAASSHIGRWTSAGVAENWPGFQHDVRVILVTVRGLIHSEKQLIRPLLLTYKLTYSA